MKKRLRKKRRLGEFQELGFEVEFRMVNVPSIEERNRVFETFVEQAIEGNDLVCGGGGVGLELGFFVTSAKRRGSATEGNRRAVGEWLAAHPLVEKYEVGPLRDAWHGWDDD